MHTAQRRVGAALIVSLAAVLTGCGTPGAPLPPSLKLPDRVTDLSAIRTGNQVVLTWTMPRRNTDKIPLTAQIDVRVCRRQGTEACRQAGQFQLAPAADGTFSETMPADLTSGPPRPVSYFVELNNARGRSAGLSDPAAVLAGAPPSPILGFAAQVRKDGIVLRWNPDPLPSDVRLRRTLVSPPPARQHHGPLSAADEAVEQSLLVAAAQSGSGHALDASITLGQTYEYRAQRVVRVALDGQSLELDGELSPPIRVEAIDVFPPAVPTGLAAVAVAADAASGAAASIDLSWQPNTETDLVGYQVYRREDASSWERISGKQPVPSPAFHDANVLAGHAYRYAVSAIDRSGHESERSVEAHETVLNP